MTPSWLHSFQQCTPEVALLVTIFGIILGDLFLERKPGAAWMQAFLGLSAATIAALMLYQVDTPTQLLMPALAATFGLSKLTVALKVLLLLLTTLAVAFSQGSLAESNRHGAEFYSMILFATLGGLLCVSARDFLLFFVAFELLSLPLYILCAFRRYESASAEAGIKYFVNGALSSALLLYGISWVYGSIGSTQFSVLEARLLELAYPPHGLLLGCLMIFAALAFKVAAAPFHNWAPDVYSGAPPASSMILATLPKVTIVGFLLQFYWLSLGAWNPHFALANDWLFLFLILATLSMFVGNLSALPQVDLRKLLAYSGVAQIGYLFLGLAACWSRQQQNSQAIAALLFYLVAYSVANLGAWAVLTWVGRRQGSLTLDSLRGLHQSQPGLALLLAVSLMSLAGVPPLAGFVGKFLLFRAIYQAGYPFLVVLGLVNSVLSLFYYFKVLKAAYFVEREEAALSCSALSSVQQLALQACLWSNLALGLWPALLEEAGRLANLVVQGK